MFKNLRQKLFGAKRVESNQRAMSRLHFVLVQDRTGLTAEEMSTFRSELMAVLEKYFVVDKQGFDVAYKRDVDSTTLLINSPIVVRRQDIPGGSVGAERGRSASKANNKAEKNEKVVSVKEAVEPTKEKNNKKDSAATANA